MVAFKYIQSGEASKFRDALLSIIEQHRIDGDLPTSVRFLLYELEAHGLISKPRDGEPRPEEVAIEVLTQLRESGDVPWTYIVDEVWCMEDYSGSDTIFKSLLDRWPDFRFDPWRGNIPLILTESRSLAGCLRPLARAYRIRIALIDVPCSGFLHTDIAPILKPSQRVLYLGDHDLSGKEIEKNVRSLLERLVGELQWERVALTEEQIERYHLLATMKSDQYSRNPMVLRAVIETEALPQRIIVSLLRERLEELLPEPLESSYQRAARERETVGHQIEMGT
jgi:hypothetical protein